MADTKLFNIKGTVKEYQSGTVTLEKELQTVIENNMNIFFGVTFLASEYRTTDGGRMDSIGIDENHCPVIFEYKRSVKENVINQGLFYLNWLLDHKDSFKVLVIEKLGLKAANNIDWSMPRVVCVAGDFTKYDESAIKQMNRNISLIRYKKFGEDLLMFEQVNENVVSAIPDNEPVSKTNAKIGRCIADSSMACLPKAFYTLLPGFRPQPHKGLEYGDVAAQINVGSCAYEMKGIIKKNTMNSGRTPKPVDVLLNTHLLSTSKAGEEIIRQFVEQGLVDNRVDLIAVIAPQYFDNSFKGTLRFLAKLGGKKVMFIELDDVARLIEGNSVIDV